MSVIREKDRSSRSERKLTKEIATQGRPKREDSIDYRPIVTQENPKRSSLKSSKDEGKPFKEKIHATEKVRKKKSEKPVGNGKQEEKMAVEKERKSRKLENGSGDTVKLKIKKSEYVEPKKKKEMKEEAISLKEVSSGRKLKKSEAVSRAIEKMIKIKDENSHSKRREEGIMKQKELEEKSKSRRDRTRTRTLSPTEVKQLIPSARISFDLAAGGQIRPSQRPKKEDEEEVISEPKEEEIEENEDYEDDFEDYESDFEEDDEDTAEESTTATNDRFDTSQDAQSDVYELKSSVKSHGKLQEIDKQWKVEVRKKEMEEIRKSIEKENIEMKERRKSVVKLVDYESDKENSFSASDVSSPVINFYTASKKQKKNKKMEENKKRGEQLLSMISLDSISYNIFEIPPIPYDDFMEAFGKSNTKQVYVQTNEDDLDEEVQTDPIMLCNKWTQNPPEYLGSRKAEASYILTKEERLGVGGDVPEEEEEQYIPQRTNGLFNFLSWASQMILIALEKKSGNFLSLENMPNHSKAMAFGDGFVYLNVGEVPFLKGRSVTHLCLMSKNLGKLLSVHVNKEKSFQKSMICVWSFRELSKPLKILVASNRVTSCSFGPNQGNLVFAGLSDGSICLWDLREPLIYHNRTINNSDWILQSPTFSTVGNLKEIVHCSPIVAIRILTKIETPTFGDFIPLQICSLDKNGFVVIWSVIQIEKTQTTNPSEDLGLAHWGRVKLVKSSSFSVFASLKDEIPGLYITCNDMLINEVEEDGFYFANSLGSVSHCSMYGSSMKPKFYVPSKHDAIIETTCLELCPFNGNYFLVGCGDGSIRLHSRHQEKPLICLNSNIIDNEKEAGVVSLTWMQMRPCVFFALDSMSRIHIWDLAVSDMYPEISLVLTEKRITCMKLLPTSDPRQIPFIVIGTEGGNIEIHRLKKQYGSRSPNDVHNEMKMFLKYVSIL